MTNNEAFIQGATAMQGMIAAYVMQKGLIPLAAEILQLPLPKHEEPEKQEIGSCKTEQESWKCSNMKETRSDMSGERYKCEVCGRSMFLDYEEMR